MITVQNQCKQHIAEKINRTDIKMKWPLAKKHIGLNAKGKDVFFFNMLIDVYTLKGNIEKVITQSMKII